MPCRYSAALPELRRRLWAPMAMLMRCGLMLQVLTVLYVAATSCLIIASRKHYTVDVVVAWWA